MNAQVDSHQHFWTLARGDYGWLTPAAGQIYRDFHPSDLRPLLRDTDIRRTVAVQAAPTVDETRYLLRLARDEDIVAAVVGWVDMDCPVSALADLTTLARDGRLRGIRPMIQDIGDVHWVLRPAPAVVFERMIEMGLCFDALVRPQHLPALRQLVARYPELPTVVDHGGKPDIANRRWQPWADRMAALAEESTARCKLSGLLTEALPSDGEDELYPYMDHLYEHFGAQRLMWGSDWPVLNLSGPDTSPGPLNPDHNKRSHGAGAETDVAPGGPYVRWHALVQRWLRSKGDEARHAIEGGTAVRFYGLAEARQGG